MIRTQIHVEAPPEEVFGLLQDGETYARWLVGANRARAVDGAIPGTGGRRRHRLRTRTARDDGDLRMIRRERPVLVELEVHGGPITAMVRFRLHSEQTGTTVVLEQGGVGVVSRLAMRVGRRFVAARNAETLWRMKQEIINGGNGHRAATEAETRVPLPRWLADVTARLFGLAAATRRSRALHPRGVTRAGEAELWGAARHLARSSNTPVVVRFSRGAGLPAGLPDFNGLGIRFVDAFGPGRHQDLLLTSAGFGHPGRLPFPAVDFGASRFSSIVRYEVGGVPVRFAAQVRATALPFDRLSTVDRLEISLLAEADGHRNEVATIVLDDVIDGSAIRFAPMLVGPDVVPLGFLNALRRPAYDASQALRRDFPTGSPPPRRARHRRVT